jgi:hypothetical protein
MKDGADRLIDKLLISRFLFLLLLNTGSNIVRGVVNQFRLGTLKS